MSYNLSICPIEINAHCALGELLNDTTVSYNSSLPAGTSVLGNNSFAAAFNQLRVCERIKEEMDREYETCQAKETTDCKCYEKVLPLKREFESCTGKASTGDKCFLMYSNCFLSQHSLLLAAKHTFKKRKSLRILLFSLKNLRKKCVNSDKNFCQKNINQ